MIETSLGRECMPDTSTRDEIMTELRNIFERELMPNELAKEQKQQKLEDFEKTIKDNYTDLSTLLTNNKISVRIYDLTKGDGGLKITTKQIESGIEQSVQLRHRWAVACEIKHHMNMNENSYDLYTLTVMHKIAASTTKLTLDQIKKDVLKALQKVSTEKKSVINKMLRLALLILTRSILNLITLGLGGLLLDYIDGQLDTRGTSRFDLVHEMSATGELNSDGNEAKVAVLRHPKIDRSLNAATASQELLADMTKTMTEEELTKIQRFTLKKISGSNPTLAQYKASESEHPPLTTELLMMPLAIAHELNNAVKTYIETLINQSTTAIDDKTKDCKPEQEANAIMTIVNGLELKNYTRYLSEMLDNLLGMMTPQRMDRAVTLTMLKHGMAAGMKMDEHVWTFLHDKNLVKTLKEVEADHNNATTEGGPLATIKAINNTNNDEQKLTKMTELSRDLDLLSVTSNAKFSMTSEKVLKQRCAEMTTAVEEELVSRIDTLTTVGTYKTWYKITHGVKKLDDRHGWELDDLQRAVTKDVNDKLIRRHVLLKKTHRQD